MSAFVQARALIGSILVCAALALSACSSSGSGSGGSGGGSTDSGPTLQQIANKIKSDPQVQALKKQMGAQANKFDAVVDCIAAVAKKDVNKSDLEAYVTGKKSLNDLASAKNKVTSDATTCLTKVLGGSSS